MLQVTCKSCDAEIPADDVNLDHMMAKCSRCNAVFGIGERGAAATADAEAAVKAEVPMPSGIALEQAGGQLTITRRWRHWLYIPMALFCCFWDGFMILWFGIAIAKGVWIMALFGTLHGAIGLGLTYFVIAGFFNRTVVTASSSLLAVRHGPLPWPGNNRFNARAVDQLYCVEKQRRTKHGYHYVYTVNVRNKQGESKVLVSGLRSAEQALYIEQEVERHLEIEDEAVRGEMA
jgi:hypothetical protein